MESEERLLCLLRLSTDMTDPGSAETTVTDAGSVTRNALEITNSPLQNTTSSLRL